MSIGDFDLQTLDVLAGAGPYPIEAYGFVHAGLGYTVRRVHGAEGDSIRQRELSKTSEPLSAGLPSAAGRGGAVDDGPPGRRHVSGQQLCLGLREFAIDRFGLFAPVVFGRWNIHRTEDFGRMVFAMIDARIMSRNSDDSLEDFRSVYDFDEAFSRDALLSGIGLRVSVPPAGLRRDC